VSIDTDPDLQVQAKNVTEDERKPKPNSLSIVEPLATPDKIAGSMRVFEELKQKLLTDEDYQAIGDKKYIKRSGFRKIALAFGLSDKILEQVRVDRPDGSFVWRIRVRVTAKNGRCSEGVAACDSRERGWAHLEHDVYSTAHTRAKSRTISDLVAGGAVSAEEMETSEGQVKRENQVKQEIVSPKTGKSFAVSLSELFPPDLAERLLFEEGDKEVIIKMKHFLPTDLFNRVATEVKKFGGIYISEGNKSRFTIPKPEI